jgi:hypothetical protein
MAKKRITLQKPVELTALKLAAQGNKSAISTSNTMNRIPTM